MTAEATVDSVAHNGTNKHSTFIGTWNRVNSGLLCSMDFASNQMQSETSSHRIGCYSQIRALTIHIYSVSVSNSQRTLDGWWRQTPGIRCAVISRVRTCPINWGYSGQCRKNMSHWGVYIQRAVQKEHAPLRRTANSAARTLYSLQCS